MEPYVPQLGIVYPSEPDGRMVAIKVRRKVIVDENYPFLDKSFKFKFIRCMGYLVIYTVGSLIIPLRCGLKIEGRDILRKHKNLLKNGAMTVANHVHR
jgi:hypothetical protein